jgi:branched-chain amino acid transport system ATP-binding protein
MAEALLELEDVAAGYGEALVLENIALKLAAGEALALLGRNGMGKTTLLATLMGHTHLLGGRARFRGRDLFALPAHRRARAGIGWVAQERAIFPSLSVEENLAVAVRHGHWNAERVHALFPALKERRRSMGHHLSGGEQQMLAIGRALMTNPVLMLLDEPLEGLAPIIVSELSAAIRRMVAEDGMAVILVEQHAETALEMTAQAIILERGRIVHASTSAALLADAATLDRLIGVGRARPAEAVRAAVLKRRARREQGMR